jgi:CelD/BcsL family acetyltransferase involved in cellulose biosynthesis
MNAKFTTSKAPVGKTSYEIAASVGNGGMDHTDFSVSVLTKGTAFASLKPEWELLFSQSQNQHCFHDFSWNFHSWNCVAAAQGQALRIIVGRERGRPVLIFPLMVKNRVARFLSADVFAYRDMLLADNHSDDWFHATWNTLLGLEEVDILHLQNVRSPSNLGRMLAIVKPPVWHVDTYSPAIVLRNYETWDTFALSRPKTLIADQRRQWRRIKAFAPNLQHVWVQDKDEVDSLVRWMIDQKASWAKQKGIPRMIWSSGREDVLRRAAQDAYDAGRLLVFKLADGQTVIAAGMGFVNNQHFTFELFSYDLKWQNFSPSRLLLEDLIRWCLDNRLELFDFLPQAAQGSLYKYDWADDKIKSTSYLIPITARGSMLIHCGRRDLSAITKSRIASSIYHWLPQPTRGLLHYVANMSSRGKGWIKLKA